MKKYLTWDFVLGVLFLFGVLVASVAFVHYSYALAEEYPAWLKYAMRSVGFLGAMAYPKILSEAVSDWISDYERNEEVEQ